MIGGSLGCFEKGGTPIVGRSVLWSVSSLTGLMFEVSPGKACCQAHWAERHMCHRQATRWTLSCPGQAARCAWERPEVFLRSLTTAIRREVRSRRQRLTWCSDPACAVRVEVQGALCCQVVLTRLPEFRVTLCLNYLLLQHIRYQGHIISHVLMDFISCQSDCPNFQINLFRKV